MRIETVAEELVCAGAITLADGAAGVVESPAGYGNAQGDEGFFFEATSELVPAVFFVEISEKWSAEDTLRRSGSTNSRVTVKRGGERCVGHIELGRSRIRKEVYV